MKIQGHKVVGLTSDTFAVIIPAWRRDYVYMVSYHFGTLTIVNHRGDLAVDIDIDGNFNQIERQAEELPLEVLRVIIKSFIQRQLA